MSRYESEVKDKIYNKMCNEVKTSSRKDKQDWLEGQCLEIEQNMGEVSKIREAYKLVKSVTRTWQVKQSAIKDKEGKTIMDKENTKQRWTEYCSELYKEDGQDYIDALGTLLSISPPQLDNAQENILHAEVEKAIRQLKNNKSPGADGVRTDTIKAG